MLCETRMMKGSICLFAALLLAISVQIKAEPVYFADPNLKVVVEEALSLTDPSPAEMLNLISLDANDIDIYDLTGLEYAANLTNLSLCCNNICDIFPISGLINLMHMNVLANPLNTLSYCTYMQSVLDNNPDVSLY